MTKAHIELKKKLMAAGIILYRNGHKDRTAGHISVRLPDQPHLFFMKPHRVGLNEMTLKNIVTINLDGELVDGPDRLHSERFIHTGIYRVRPDVQSVIHTHPKNAIILSGSNLKWKVYNHGAALFHGNMLGWYDDTLEKIDTPELGTDVAKVLAKGRAVLLKNHGIVVADGSIEQVTVAAIELEEAAEIQVRAASTHAMRREFSPAKIRKFATGPKGHGRKPQMVESFNYFAREAGCKGFDLK